MNRLFIVFALLYFVPVLDSKAQSAEEIEEIREESAPQSSIYLSTTSPFEKYNSVDVGYMRVLDKGNAVGVELGYIFNIEGLNSTVDKRQFQNIHGAKAYFYYRFLLDNSSTYPYNSTTFVDLEPQLFWTSFQSERIAGYSCDDQFGDCEYYRFFDSRVQKIVPGFNLKFGKIYNYDLFYFSLFAGGGIQYAIEFSEIDSNLAKPDKLFNRDDSDSQTRTGAQLNYRIGFQVGYKL